MLILFYTTHALFDQNVSDVKTRQASTAITAVMILLSEMADGTFCLSFIFYLFIFIDIWRVVLFFIILIHTQYHHNDHHHPQYSHNHSRG